MFSVRFLRETLSVSGALKWSKARHFAGLCCFGRLLKHCCHLFQDRFGRLGGIGRLSNGPADNQVAGALAKGFSGSGDALLVADSGAGRADAGNRKNAFGTGESA